MKKLLFLMLLLFSTLIGCRQKGKTEISKPKEIEYDTIADEDMEYYDGQACVYIKSTNQPSNTFPFNKSDRIELVAYEDRRGSYSNDELIQDGKFIVSNILQRRALNKKQQDSLFSILYNFKRLVTRNDSFGADCYDPHHSIVFYEEGKAIAFYEICFSCGGTRQTKGVDFGQFCNEKLCTLQRFFRSNKIDKQIIDEMCEVIAD